MRVNFRAHPVWAKILTSAALLLAAGCTPTVVDTSCTSFGPITYSARQDTADTVMQVRRHNAAWDAICR